MYLCVCVHMYIEQILALMLINTHWHCLYTHLHTYICYLGGNVVASPPSDSVTSVTADFFLPPGGSGFSLLSTWDQIHCSPYHVWGGSVPQASIPHDHMTRIVQGLAAAANARGLVGHLSLDLVTFIDAESSVSASSTAIQNGHMPSAWKHSLCVCIRM